MSELFSAMRGFAHGRSKALGILPDVGGLKAEAFDAFLYACQLARSSRLLYQKVYDPWDWWRTLTRMKTAAHAKAAFLVEVMEVILVKKLLRHWKQHWGWAMFKRRTGRRIAAARCRAWVPDMRNDGCAALFLKPSERPMRRLFIQYSTYSSSKSYK